MKQQTGPMLFACLLCCAIGAAGGWTAGYSEGRANQISVAVEACAGNWKCDPISGKTEFIYHGVNPRLSPIPMSANDELRTARVVNYSIQQDSHWVPSPKQEAPRPETIPLRGNRGQLPSEVTDPCADGNRNSMTFTGEPTFLEDSTR